MRVFEPVTLTIIGLIVAGYMAVVGAMFTFQRNMLYLPSTATPSPAASGVPEMAVVKFETADGLELMSWYRPADGDRPTMIYFHGNGGHIGYRAAKVRPYLDAGFGLLLVSYRGYGGNPGSPDEEGLYADGRAAMAFVAARGVPPARTVIYGESLGTGVAVHIAAGQAHLSRPVGALVLEAPLSSAADVGAHHYPWAPVRWLMKDRFDSKAKIAAVGTPVFVLHGERDRVVPIRFGRALFAAAVDPKESLWLPDADHDNLEVSGAVIDFLDRHFGNRP
jgi:fermentation-respiration switch protein FrsA (DUF1100 family)